MFKTIETFLTDPEFIKSKLTAITYVEGVPADGEYTIEYGDTGFPEIYINTSAAIYPSRGAISFSANARIGDIIEIEAEFYTFAGSSNPRILVDVTKLDNTSSRVITISSTAREQWKKEKIRYVITDEIKPAISMSFGRYSNESCTCKIRGIQIKIHTKQTTIDMYNPNAALYMKAFTVVKNGDLTWSLDAAYKNSNAISIVKLDAKTLKLAFGEQYTSAMKPFHSIIIGAGSPSTSGKYIALPAISDRGYVSWWAVDTTTGARVDIDTLPEGTRFEVLAWSN
jgi:hypothetical protein